MISFLEGEVVEKAATRVVLGVGGVGYDVLVPTSVVAELPAGRRDDARSTPGWSCARTR